MNNVSYEDGQVIRLSLLTRLDYCYQASLDGSTWFTEQYYRTVQTLLVIGFNIEAFQPRVIG